MELNTLKKLRLRVPGVLIFLVFILSINNSFSELKEFYKALTNFNLKLIIYIVLFMALGVIYYACKIRYKLWDPFLKRVQDNIKETLLEPFNAEFNDKQKTNLKSNRVLMNVFYEFVDNNESLKEKAKSVRFNGLIWTSCIDATIIFFCGSIVMFIKHVITSLKYDLVVACCLFLVFLISLVLIFALTRNHIRLSNEQLEVITGLHKETLRKRLRSLL